MRHTCRATSSASGRTATEWAGRLLVKSESARYPNIAVWIDNGVNLTLRGDVARRAYEIRIVVDDTQPWRLECCEQRYRHPKLMEWADSGQDRSIGSSGGPEGRLQFFQSSP